MLGFTATCWYYIGKFPEWQYLALITHHLASHPTIHRGVTRKTLNEYLT